MDIWKHGKYVDTWSIIHFFSGVLLAGVFYIFNYSFIEALIFSFVLLVAWEGFEWVISIIEPSVNVAVDLLVGMLGFLCGAYFYYMFQIPFSISFYSVAFVTFALAAWGFIDFKQRGYR